MDDCCRLVLPYNAVHSTVHSSKQIPNDPPEMGANSTTTTTTTTTTSNHPSTPLMLVKPLTMIIIELSSFHKIYTKLLKYIFKIIIYRKKYCKP